MIKVLPAIIPINKEQLTLEIEKISHFADLVQIDISDGVFTSTKTWPYNGKDLEFFEDLKNENSGWPKWQDIDIELHLMVQKPEDVLEDWIKTGISSVVIHIESTENMNEIIEVCIEKNISIGIAIKPSTSIEKIKNLVSSVDFVQVMGSDDLGKHGVSLEENAKEMITLLRAQFPDSIIAIDIGVTEENAQELVGLGINKIISGGAILNSTNPKEVFDYLKSL